jgi:hypothetical protein
VLDYQHDRAPEVVEQRRGGDQQLTFDHLRHGVDSPTVETRLDTARVFERIFEIYGQQFTLLIPAALLLFIPVSVVDGLLLADGGLLTMLLGSTLVLIATFWYQGMTVEAVVDILDGRRDQTIGSLFSTGARFIGPLLGAAILAGLGITIGLLLLIVPGLYLITIWAVVVPAIVIDGNGIGYAFGRSRSLVRGSRWRVFGVIVVLVFLQVSVGFALQAIAGDSFAGYAIVDLVVNVLIVPLNAIGVTVLYVELRRLRGEPLQQETTA